MEVTLNPSIEPIGFLKTNTEFKAQTPRQGVLSKSSGVVELIERKNFEQALLGLEGFKKIWLIYTFHKNTHWKPMVRPQNLDEKIGVFATRAPYRPNQIGMSCVSLEKIKGRRLFISQHDLLDETPILDIKPYIPYADSFSNEEALNDLCWWQEDTNQYEVKYAPRAQEKALWLKQQAEFDISNFISSQLVRKPTDSSRKRVRSINTGYELSVRTWKVIFAVDETQRHVEVRDMLSTYATVTQLPAKSEYLGAENEVTLHRKFLTAFA